MMYLYFLLASAAFCVDGPEVSAIPMDDNILLASDADHKVYANLNGQIYGDGSVWVRPCGEGSSGVVAYYRSKDDGVFSRAFSQDQLDQPHESHMKLLFEDVARGSQDKPWQEVCSEKYHVPATDLTCAAVTELRERLTLSCCHDGVQHPEFNSWARYMPRSSVRTLSYTDYKSIFPRGDRSQMGSLWLAKESGKTILFYGPEFGPEWMYYRYDLEQDAGWPKNWLSSLEAMRKFYSSGTHSMIGYDGERKDLDVIKAVLSGRTARWDENMWFAWQPQCKAEDPFLKVHQNDLLHTGEAKGGVYQPGSAWMVNLSGRAACRILSEDGTAFQIAAAKFSANVDELLYLAPSNGELALSFVAGTAVSQTEL